MANTARMYNEYPRLLADLNDLSVWQMAEQRFAAHDYDGTPGESIGDGVLLLPMRNAETVVFTAPHAVNHERDGNDKLADRGTGGLAVALHTRAGFGALIAAQRIGGDANFDPSHPLKDLLSAVRHQTRAVIDLHGMSKDHAQADVVIGTAHNALLGAPLGRIAKASIEAEGLTVSVNAPFDARRPTTITSFAHKLGIPAIQLEISPFLRPPLWDTRCAMALLSGLLTLTRRAPVPITAMWQKYWTNTLSDEADNPLKAF